MNPSNRPANTPEFLRTSMLGAAATWTLPVFLEKTFFTLDAMAADSLTQTATGKDNTILVVLQMAGGNDGLNMVVPFADDVYHRLRPKLVLPADKILKLEFLRRFEPRLTGLKSLFDEGHLSVMQGVGYPNPNRSHFRSTEIWQTASDADRNENEGWLGRYFDNCCAGADPTVGVAIGDETPQAFAAKTPTGVTFSRPEQFRWRPSETTEGKMSAEEFFFRQLNWKRRKRGSAGHGGGRWRFDRRDRGQNKERSEHAGFPAAHRARRAIELRQNSGDRAQIQIDRALSAGPTGLQPEHDRAHDRGRFADARLLREPGRIRHARRPNKYARPFDGRTQRRARRVRRRSETAGKFRARAIAYLQRVRPARCGKCERRDRPRRGCADVSHWRRNQPGLFGKYPSLTDLDHGDLKFNTDFRSVYGTVLDKWLHAPSEVVLGRKFPALPIV